MFKKTCWTLAIAYLLIFTASFSFAAGQKKKKRYYNTNAPTAVCKTSCTKSGITYAEGDVQAYAYLNCARPLGCITCQKCLYRVTFLVDVLQNDGTWEVIEDYCGEGQLVCESSGNFIALPIVHTGVNEFNAILNIYDYNCGSCSTPVIPCQPIGGAVLVGPP